MTNYFLSRNGKTFGPYTVAQLGIAASTGKLLPADKLAPSTEGPWRKATDFPELRGLFQGEKFSFGQASSSPGTVPQTQKVEAEEHSLPEGEPGYLAHLQKTVSSSEQVKQARKKLQLQQLKQQQLKTLTTPSSQSGQGLLETGEANLPLAILAACGVAVLGAFVWFISAATTGYVVGFLAIFIGLSCGWVVRKVGKGTGSAFGITGAVTSFFGCALGNLLCGLSVFSEPIDLVFYGLAIGVGYRLSKNKIDETSPSTFEKALGEAGQFINDPGRKIAELAVEKLSTGTASGLKVMEEEAVAQGIRQSVRAYLISFLSGFLFLLFLPWTGASVGICIGLGLIFAGGYSLYTGKAVLKPGDFSYSLLTGWKARVIGGLMVIFGLVVLVAASLGEFDSKDGSPSAGQQQAE